MLRENKVLTSLGLQWCRLGPEGLCEVYSAVGMNTTLTSLNLSRKKLNDRHEVYIVKVMVYTVEYIGQ